MLGLVGVGWATWLLLKYYETQRAKQLARSRRVTSEDDA
jgi:hypothetical protein